MPDLLPSRQSLAMGKLGQVSPKKNGEIQKRNHLKTAPSMDRKNAAQKVPYQVRGGAWPEVTLHRKLLQTASKKNGKGEACMQIPG